MADFTVNKSDGSAAAIITDGTVDSTSVSISLVGRDIVDYGEIIAETQVHIMENFANNASPSFPTRGQLWWDTSVDVLNIFDGSSFVGVALASDLSGFTTALNDKVELSGDTMTGALVLSGPPTIGLHASTKDYVDAEILSVSSGILSNLVEDTTPQLGGQLDAQNFKIVNVGTPTLDSDATTKLYVDNIASGLDTKESVRVATTADLGFIYVDNGGVGDTLTAPAPGTTTFDTVLLADNDRVLVKDESDAKQNGIYVASDASIGSATVLTRATDQDGTPSNEVSGGNFTFVEQGLAHISSGWVVVGDGTLTLNTDDINWTQFSNVGGVIDAATLDGLDSSDFLQVALSQSYNKQKFFSTDTLVDGASIAWNLDDSQVATVTLGGSRLLSTPTNMKNGGTYVLTVKQDGAGSRSLSYGGAYKWSNGVVPTLSSAPNATDIITFVSDGSSMFGVAQLNFS